MRSDVDDVLIVVIMTRRERFAADVGAHRPRLSGVRQFAVVDTSSELPAIAKGDLVWSMFEVRSGMCMWQVSGECSNDDAATFTTSRATKPCFILPGV